MNSENAIHCYNYTDLSSPARAPGEVCSSRVGAGPTEEDPVIRVPSEEAGGGALGSPDLSRSQGRGSTHHWDEFVSFHER